MLLFMDGFDQYSTAQLSMQYNPQAGTINEGGGRFGGNAFSPSGPTRHPIAPSGTSGVIIGFALINPTGDILDLLDTAGHKLVTVYYSALNNQISVLDNTRAVIVSTAIGSINPGIWTYVEVMFAGWGSNKTVTIQLGGITQSTGAGDTSPAQNIPAYFEFDSGAGAIDDLYVFDTSGTACNTFAGQSRVDTRFPVANGRVNNFAPVNQTVGGSYTCVDDEVPDDDQTYTFDNTPGDTDTYRMGTPSPLPSSVVAVQVSAAIRSDGVTPISVKIGVGNGSAEDYGAPQTPTTSYTYLNEPLSTNPLTGQPWTPSDLNNLQAAFQI